MVDNISTTDHEIALFTGKLQTIITFLHKRLQKFLIENFPNDVSKIVKFDFSECNYCIIDNWKNVFSKFCDKNLKKIAERSIKIRNYISHQSLGNLNDLTRLIEPLRLLAVHVKCDVACSEIGKIIVISSDKKEKTSDQNNNDSDNSEWIKLKETGNECFKQGLYTEAMISYTKAIAINNKQAVLYSNRALAELKLKKYEEAREDAEDAIELDEKNVKYFRLLSEALQNLGLSDEAVNACQKGLEIDSRDESLVLRLRDLNSIVSRQLTDQNPNDMKESLEKLQIDPEYLNDEMKKMFDIKNPNPCDIRILSEIEFLGISKLTKELYDAHNYYHGFRGKPRNELRSFEIFEKVAKEGNAEALYNLGRFYKSGNGVCEIDYGRMWELYKKAASQKPYYKVPQGVPYLGDLIPNLGVAEAELEMGNAYRDGRGVDIDNEKAFKHYTRAAELGCAHAQNNLGVFLYQGISVKCNLKYAREWYRRAAEHGNGEAQINYAQMLEQGEGGLVCEKEAIEYYRKAANQGSPDALMHLQRLAASVPTHKSDNDKASKIFDQAEQDPNLLFVKGLNYFEGQYGFQKSYELAYKCWKQAADEHDHDKSVNALYRLLLGEMKRPYEGFEYCLKANKNGNYETKLQLVQLYTFGHGCNRDVGEARKLFKRAKLQVPKDKNIGDLEKQLEVFIKCGKEVCEFELLHNLAFDGMTLDDRKMRCMRDKIKDTISPEISNRFTKSFQSMSKANPLPCDTVKLASKFSSIPKLMVYAENGSITALNEVNGLNHILEAEECIKNNKNEELMAHLRESFHLRGSRFLFTGRSDELMRALDNCDSKNENAMFIRACLYGNDIKSCVAYLKRCIRMYPNVADFHFLLGCQYGFNQNHQDSLRGFNRALELQYRPSWLYNKATSLRLCFKQKGDCKKIIDAYQEFINANPPDNRKIPYSYYSIAYMYTLNKDIMNVRLNYYKGKCADDNLLPCFEKDDDFPPKHTAELFLLTSSDTNSCGYCGKDKPKYKCPCSEQAYCDKNCQTSNWNFHKQTCKTKKNIKK